MKKIIVLIVIVLCISLIGCNADSDDVIKTRNALDSGTRQTQEELKTEQEMFEYITKMKENQEMATNDYVHQNNIAQRVLKQVKGETVIAYKIEELDKNGCYVMEVITSPITGEKMTITKLFIAESYYYIIETKDFSIEPKGEI